LEAILAILQRSGVDIDVDELNCILANLIVQVLSNKKRHFNLCLQKKMKGYISYVHQTLVLSKIDPFPAVGSKQID
jgi:hypothetical protein